MLGRNGCKWAYDEIVLMDNFEEANIAYKAFSDQLSSLSDYESGLIKLDIYTLTVDKPVLRLRQSWKSEYNVRFVTDGKWMGINYRPKKIPFEQFFAESDLVFPGQKD